MVLFKTFTLFNSLVTLAEFVITNDLPIDPRLQQHDGLKQTLSERKGKAPITQIWAQLVKL